MCHRVSTASLCSKTQRKFSYFYCAIFLGLSINWGQPAHAAELLKTSSGKSIQWITPTIKVGVDASAMSKHLSKSDVRDALRGAIKAWNSLAEIRVQFKISSDTADTVIRFCSGTWLNPAGLLAHSEFRADSRNGLVESALIEINECDFRFLGPDEIHEGRFDLQSVLAHELGHVLGLAHSKNPTAIMFANSGSRKQRHPTMDDRNSIAALFANSPLPEKATMARVLPSIETEIDESVVIEDGPDPEPKQDLASAPSQQQSNKSKKLSGRLDLTGVKEPIISAVKISNKNKNKTGSSRTLVTGEPTIKPAKKSRKTKRKRPAKRRKRRAGKKANANDDWGAWAKKALENKKKGKKGATLLKF